MRGSTPLCIDRYIPLSPHPLKEMVNCQTACLHELKDGTKIKNAEAAEIAEKGRISAFSAPSAFHFLLFFAPFVDTPRNTRNTRKKRLCGVGRLGSLAHVRRLANDRQRMWPGRNMASRALIARSAIRWPAQARRTERVFADIAGEAHSLNLHQSLRDHARSR